MKDCFEILNILPSSSFVDIKKAFRELVFKFHPDRAQINKMTFDEANSKTQKIIEAYSFIINNLEIYKNNFEKAASDYKVEWEERINVKSSNVDWVEYFQKLRILIVCFKSGDIYLYENVPESIFSGLICSTSKGRFMRNNISYSFRYQRLKEYDEWYDFAKNKYDEEHFKNDK